MTHKLPESDRIALRDLVSRIGPKPAARQLGVSVTTVARALAELDIQGVTVTAMQLRLSQEPLKAA